MQNKLDNPPPPPSPPSASTQNQDMDAWLDSNTLIFDDAARHSPLPPEGNSVYDVPPPPVPSRGYEGKDPFCEDPFANNLDEFWEDPAAFYDRPPPPRAMPMIPAVPPTNRTLPELPEKDQVRNQVSIEECSSDFTGGSTYEDTSEFLKLSRKKEPEEMKPEKAASKTDHFAPAIDIYQNIDTTMKEEEEEEGGMVHYDDPPSGFETEPIANPEEEDTGSDITAVSYDFPTALSRHPYRGDKVEPHSHDEPAMHVLNYASKAGGSNMSRQLSNSDPRLPSRQDMPLPPLPSDPHLLPPFDHSAPPPLPARPTGMKHLPQPKEGPPHHVVSNPPPLPPYRKVQQGILSAEDHPPLPPRKKNANGNTSPPCNYDSSPRSSLERARGGGMSTAREDAIMELVSLGYSRSDVVRAMAVAGNDYQLAKSILKEFGSR